MVRPLLLQHYVPTVYNLHKYICWYIIVNAYVGRYLCNTSHGNSVKHRFLMQSCGRPKINLVVIYHYEIHMNEVLQKILVRNLKKTILLEFEHVFSPAHYVRFSWFYWHFWTNLLMHICSMLQVCIIVIWSQGLILNSGR